MAFGVSEADARDMLADGEDEPRPAFFDVHPENWPVITLFTKVARRCWEVVPMVGVVGLNAQRMESAFRMRGIVPTESQLDDLDLMAEVIVSEWSKKKVSK